MKKNEPVTYFDPVTDRFFEDGTGMTNVYNPNMEYIRMLESLKNADIRDGKEKVYHLIGPDGKPYDSLEPGTLGGYSRMKIYGRLDCPSALRHIANGNYVKYRVFFRDEITAIAAGYRPCAKCMPEQYKRWKAAQELKKQGKEQQPMTNEEIIEKCFEILKQLPEGTWTSTGELVSPITDLSGTDRESVLFKIHNALFEQAEEHGLELKLEEQEVDSNGMVMPTGLPFSSEFQVYRASAAQMKAEEI